MKQARAGDRQLAETFRLIRDTLNLTQHGWADVLGVRPLSVWRWESGERMPSEQTLMHVSEVLRRPMYRRRLHRHPDVEARLIALDVIPPLADVVNEWQQMHDALVEMDAIRPILKRAA